MMTSCPICGSSDLKTEVRAHRYTECGLSGILLLDVQVTTCGSCGEEMIHLPAIEQLHRLLAQAIQKKQSELSSAEFRFLRKFLGHSREDFAKCSGLPVQAIADMEEGSAPTFLKSALDRLIRLMVASGQPVRSYDLDDLARISQPPHSLNLHIRHIMATAQVAVPEPWVIDSLRKTEAFFGPH